jgi:hypothetical protein
MTEFSINTCDDSKCTDSNVEETQKNGRTELRKTFIYKDISGISEEWTALKRLIRVERHVYGNTRQSHETACYISDIVSNKAEYFARHIRNHWGIENRLHWVKAVILKEDASKIKQGAAPENISIMRNIVCNIFRASGFDSIKYAIELKANNFKELFELICSNSNKCKKT